MHIAHVLQSVHPNQEIRRAGNTRLPSMPSQTGLKTCTHPVCQGAEELERRCAAEPGKCSCDPPRERPRGRRGQHLGQPPLGHGLPGGVVLSEHIRLQTGRSG